VIQSKNSSIEGFSILALQDNGYWLMIPERPSYMSMPSNQLNNAPTQRVIVSIVL